MPGTASLGVGQLTHILPATRVLDLSSSMGSPSQVAFALFDILLFKCGAVSHSLMPIRSELLQCVYTHDALERTTVAWNQNYVPPGGELQPTQTTILQLLDAQTYFDLARDLQVKLETERQLAEQRLLQGQDSTRRRCEAEAAISQARKVALVRVRGGTLGAM